MAETTSPRFGLTRWGAGTDTPSRSEFDANFGVLEAGAALFGQGTRAARPISGKTGRFYMVTGDSNPALNGLLFYDTGSTWLLVGTVQESSVVVPSANNAIGLVVEGLAGQSAMLQVWRDSDDVVLASLDHTGKFTATGLQVAGNADVDGDLNVDGDFTALSSTVTDLNTTNLAVDRYKSTANRSSGTPKTDIRNDGYARMDGLIPPGTIVMTAAAVAPAGWLLCQGQAVAQADYPDLFAALGGASSPYGVSAPNFTIPNLQGRFALGAGATPSSGTARPLGSVSGSDIMTTAQMPAHNHDVGRRAAAGGNANVAIGAGVTASEGPQSTANTGGGAPYMPPYTVVNYIIKV